jgi:hypothetical protein
MGGLGNQLFQIFTTISYSIQIENKFIFFNLKTLGGGGQSTLRNTYWDTFFINLRQHLIQPNSINTNVFYKFRETDFTYNSHFVDEFEKHENILIHGYFQSYKYFQENYSLICDEILDVCSMKKQIINKLRISNDFFENTISLHFRIGDYKQIQECHPLVSYEYYTNALNYIKNIYPNNKFNVLFFCEEVDFEDVLKIIKKLANIFSEFTFIRGEKTLFDWEQLLLMSCCHHNIIANSSFSWWAAYLNSWQDNKIVCYPSIWFGEKLNYNNTVDLCPPDWVKIEV